MTTQVVAPLRTGAPDAGIAPAPAAELAVAAAGLALLAVAVWGSQVFHGGLYWADDWHSARLHLFPDGQGFFGSVNTHVEQYSPVLALLLMLPFKAFGVHPAPLLALAIALAVAASLSFYWLLRTLGLAPIHAGTVAALALVFPWSDSSRLWVTGSMNNAAVIFYFVGLGLALRGLDRRGWRTLPFGAGSVLLYVLSIVTYPITAAAVLAGLPLYVHRAGWRRGLARWPFDLAGGGAAIAYIAAHQPKNHALPTTHEAWLDHAEHMAQQAGDLFLHAALPSSAVPRAVTVAIVVVTVAACALTLLHLPASDPVRAGLGRWLAIAMSATASTAVAYAPFVPGKPKYLPAALGIQNRVNLFAAFALVLAVYALAMAAGTLVARTARRPPSFAVAIAAVLTAMVAAGYVHRDAADKRLWATAWREERQQLALARRLIPHPPPGTRLYSFAVRNYASPGIPIFAVPNDYRDALRVTYRSAGVDGRVMRRGTHWRCARNRMFPVDRVYGYQDGVEYGRGFFVGMRERRAVRIRNPAACRRWSARFGNGPVSQAVARRYRLARARRRR